MTQQVAERDSPLGVGYYGYGVVTGELNDSTALYHAGGMVGYSAMLAGDLFAGVGAVAIVNGPGNPHQIAWHALECMQASAHRRPLPEAPEQRDPTRVENAAGFVGIFRAPDGRGNLTLRADGERLQLERSDAHIALEQRGSDRFYVPDEDFALFLLRFVRDDAGTVTEASFGPDWYVHERYDGPTNFDCPAEWNAIPGHFRSHNPWFSNSRVILRKGALVLVYPSGSEEPLVPQPDGSFRAGDDERSPERYRFDTIVDGVAQRMLHSGETFYRFFTP